MVRKTRPAAVRVTGLVLLALVGVAGCGGNKFAPEPPPAGTPAATVAPNDAGPIKITVQNATDLKLRPSVRVNTGTLPAQLQTTDLVPGTGRQATAANTVTVQYVGVVARTGQEFDASWDTGAPATFALNSVVPGFRNGIAGMKEGGRRQIVIPPDQGYGAQGYGSLIGPNEHLIFIVDLIKIDS
jgi:peptidylprolyl isomerase